MSDPAMMSSEGSSDQCRTVVVTGVPDVMSNERMSDKLTIHFQSTRSHGGDVEDVQYPTHLKGVAFVTFENWRDADRVVRINQVLKDKEFAEEYPLTVYKFTPEVAFYAYAEMDLSLFPDLTKLITTLRSTHRSVRIKPSLTKAGFASAEGPFSALRELRTDLLSRAQSLRDMQPSPDKAEPSGLVEEEETKTDGSMSFWLDSHVYKYIQMLDKEEWDKCIGRYNVTAQAVSTGDVTKVVLHGDGDVSDLATAHAELLKLVAEREATLRTQLIHYTSSDPAERKCILRACESEQNFHRDVCYIPAESCVEVIGPAVSSHLFCEMVKIKADLRQHEYRRYKDCCYGCCCTRAVTSATLRDSSGGAGSACSWGVKAPALSLVSMVACLLSDFLKAGSRRGNATATAVARSVDANREEDRYAGEEGKVRFRADLGAVCHVTTCIWMRGSWPYVTVQAQVCQQRTVEWGRGRSAARSTAIGWHASKKRMNGGAMFPEAQRLAAQSPMKAWLESCGAETALRLAARPVIKERPTR
ncbi:hypothetical protein NFI96_021872 [Prochilodus magdalenae]|nr:hypothetical protein NFI96_021872 [Prochilodus magdalenae]